MWSREEDGSGRLRGTVCPGSRGPVHTIQECPQPSPAPLSAFPAKKPKKTTEHGPVTGSTRTGRGCVWFRCVCLQRHVSVLFYFILMSKLFSAQQSFAPLSSSKAPFYPLQRQPSNQCWWPSQPSPWKQSPERGRCLRRTRALSLGVTLPPFC